MPAFQNLTDEVNGSAGVVLKCRKKGDTCLIDHVNKGLGIISSEVSGVLRPIAVREDSRC